MKLKLIFLVIFFSSYVVFGQNGIYHSSFIVMGQSMRMTMDVDSLNAKAKVWNSDKESQDMVVNYTCVDNKFRFEIKMIGLQYEGNYFQIGDSISGTMKQGGLVWEACFTREQKEKVLLQRPQTPLQPYPFYQEDLIIKSADGTKLSGTYFSPNKKNTAIPLVIFASGSGPQNRDMNIFDHQLFLVIAHDLAQKGIASFRFDDRGTGNSEGKFSNASLLNFGQDVEAIVQYFSTKKRFKKHKIGLLGHSEGGMHILMAQNEKVEQVKFMIFLACIGGSAKDVLVQQQYDIPLASGETEEIARWQSNMFKSMSEFRLEESANMKKKMRDFLDIHYDTCPKRLMDEGVLRKEFIESNMAFFEGQWIKEFLQFQAKEYLNKVNVPCLMLFGEKDLQVSASFNQAEFIKNLPSTTPRESHIIENTNHLLQPCKKCTVEEYGENSVTIDATYLRFISDFVLQLK